MFVFARWSAKPDSVKNQIFASFAFATERNISIRMVDINPHLAEKWFGSPKRMIPPAPWYLANRRIKVDCKFKRVIEIVRHDETSASR